MKIAGVLFVLFGILLCAGASLSVLGIPLIIAGVLLTLTIAGAVVGIPLIVFGLLLMSAVTGLLFGIPMILIGVALLVSASRQSPARGGYASGAPAIASAAVAKNDLQRWIVLVAGVAFIVVTAFGIPGWQQFLPGAGFSTLTAGTSTSALIDRANQVISAWFNDHKAPDQKRVQQLVAALNNAKSTAAPAVAANITNVVTELNKLSASE